jgi:hypothetical protein
MAICLGYAIFNLFNSAFETTDTVVTRIGRIAKIRLKGAAPLGLRVHLLLLLPSDP